MKRSMRRRPVRGLLLYGLLVLAIPGLASAQNTFPLNGNAGIGTITPATALEIKSDGAVLSGTLSYIGYFHNTAASPLGVYFGYNTSGNVAIIGSSGASSGGLAFTTGAFPERMRIDAAGNVGIGTSSPSNLLDISGSNPTARITASNAGGGARLILTTLTRDWRVITHNAVADSFYLYDGTAAAVRLLVDTSGNVGIGTMTPAAKLQVAGDALVDGNIAAKYQDVAEWVPSPLPLSSGIVVVVAAAVRNQVVPASNPYDTRVAGVVSSRPGLLLGEAGDNKVKVAHSGRVKVKVDASYGPVAVGDLLVTSPTTGHAMRSTLVELGGTSIHRPGTVLGKALEPLEAGQGEILVLLTLQ